VPADTWPPAWGSRGRWFESSRPDRAESPRNRRFRGSDFLILPPRFWAGGGQPLVTRLPGKRARARPRVDAVTFEPPNEASMPGHASFDARRSKLRNGRSKVRCLPIAGSRTGPRRFRARKTMVPASVGHLVLPTTSGPGGGPSFILQSSGYTYGAPRAYPSTQSHWQVQSPLPASYAQESVLGTSMQSDSLTHSSCGV
jgi:hypothetical protein